MSDCAFCTTDDLAYRTVIETPEAFAFLNKTPIVPGHVLISPKRHVQRYEDLSSGEKDAIEALRMKLHTALTTVFGAKGFNYAWNEGGVGGQSVPHFHLHMLPRKQGDTGVYEYEPRQFLYRAAPVEGRPESPEAELKDIANRLRG